MTAIPISSPPDRKVCVGIHLTAAEDKLLDHLAADTGHRRSAIVAMLICAAAQDRGVVVKEAN